jgi:hypothetical protein
MHSPLPTLLTALTPQKDNIINKIILLDYPKILDETCIQRKLYNEDNLRGPIL